MNEEYFCLFSSAIAFTLLAIHHSIITLFFVLLLNEK